MALWLPDRICEHGLELRTRLNDGPACDTQRRSGGVCGLLLLLMLFVEWSDSGRAAFAAAEYVCAYNEAARHGTRW